MAKKLHFYRVLPCTLAVLATVAFIVACGQGDTINVGGNIGVDIDNAVKALVDDESKLLQIAQKSSASIEGESSSSENNGGEESASSEGSSSSEEEPSSASLLSSSNDAPSSASESPYRIECNVRATGTTGVENVLFPVANRPEVKCIEKANPANVVVLDPEDDVRWSGHPNWKTPAKGSYSDIRVEAFPDAKACKYLDAKCEGTITITAPSSSSRAIVITPSSSSVYVPPTTTSSSAYVPPTTTSSSSVAASGGGVCSSNETRGDNCLWNGAGDCWPIKDQADRTNCGKNAWIFQGGTTGAGSLCKGGTFLCGKDSSPPTGSAPSLGCCKWDTETKCWDVYTEKEKTDCSGGSNKFWSSKCPGTEGACPSN